MKTVKRHWAKLAGVTGLTCLALLTAYACVTSRAQTAPILAIARTGTNQVTVTFVNGATNGLYSLYSNEFLGTTPNWVLVTNGTTGQTNFPVLMGDAMMGFFLGVSNYTAPTYTLSVVIQSPTNGALLY